MGLSAAGAGVPAVWGGGDDAEAGGAGEVYLLVSGLSALGGVNKQRQLQKRVLRLRRRITTKKLRQGQQQ